MRGTGDNLYFAPGVFRDAAGKVVDEPPPLVVGKADSAAVVGSDGIIVLTGRTLRAPRLAGGADAGSAAGGDGEVNAPSAPAPSATVPVPAASVSVVPVPPTAPTAPRPGPALPPVSR